MNTFDETTKSELEASLAELKHAIAECEAAGVTVPAYQREAVARYEDEIANLPEAMRNDRSHSLTARPKAGGAATNQYGTFTVSYATPKQTGYIRHLMETHDLSQADPKKLNVAELRQQVADHQVNKKAASAIIDFLLALPEVEHPEEQLGSPATAKQKLFVRTLLAERAGNETAESVRRMLNRLREEYRLTASAVSEAIDALLEIKVESSTAVSVPDGRYALPAGDGHYIFYKVDNVTEGKWAGYTFVVQLVGSVGAWDEQRIGKAQSWEILNRIAADSQEAARMFGIKAKACGHCSSPLSNIQSRAAGYGETCAHNHGYFYPTVEEARTILAERGETVD